MHIGVLQFVLLIRGSESIKDKRRVVRSVKDRLHREHQISVAEVAHLDSMHSAGMAAAVVAGSAARVKESLDVVRAKLEGLHDAELRNCHAEVLSGEQLPLAFADETGEPLWSEQERREMEARGAEALGEEELAVGQSGVEELGAEGAVGERGDHTGDTA